MTYWLTLSQSNGTSRQNLWNQEQNNLFIFQLFTSGISLQWKKADWHNPLLKTLWRRRWTQTTGKESSLQWAHMETESWSTIQQTLHSTRRNNHLFYTWDKDKLVFTFWENADSPSQHTKTKLCIWTWNTNWILQQAVIKYLWDGRI
jgi:hypothetical protein